MNNTLVKQNARLKHSSAMFGNKIMAYVVNVDVNVIMQVHQCKSSKSLCVHGRTKMCFHSPVAGK